MVPEARIRRQGFKNRIVFIVTASDGVSWSQLELGASSQRGQARSHVLNFKWGCAHRNPDNRDRRHVQHNCQSHRLRLAGDTTFGMEGKMCANTQIVHPVVSVFIISAVRSEVYFEDISDHLYQKGS